MTQPQQWERAFDDWQRLLQTANAQQLIHDPKAVWDEAWRQATMIAMAIVTQELPSGMSVDLNQKLERKLLK